MTLLHRPYPRLLSDLRLMVLRGVSLFVEHGLRARANIFGQVGAQGAARSLSMATSLSDNRSSEG